MSKGGSSILKNLQEIDKLKFEKEIKQFQNNSIIPIKNFNIPEELLEWFTTGCVEILIINGLSGMVKTELIKSFLKSKNIEFLFIRNVHGLRDYNPQVHKAVINFRRKKRKLL
uniref:Orf112a n=1 Tax=Phytophthora sojae TaxID=67593 RepID=A4ZH95_PHYSO|nr:orf112a [Phytophthora sojae]ABG54064.1 orf112a [Phytophthora sojae]